MFKYARKLSFANHHDPPSTKRNYVENSFLYQSGSALKQRRKMLSLFRNVYCYQIYIIKRGVANYLACMSASFLFFAVQGCFFLNFCQCFIFRDAFLLFLNTILLSRIRVDGVRRMYNPVKIANRIYRQTSNPWFQRLYFFP